MIKWIPLILILYSTSCNYVLQEKNNNSEFNLENFKKDSISAVDKAKEIDNKFNLELIDSEIDNDLEQNVDTLILTDMRFACDCPSWFDSLGYYTSIEASKRSDNIDVNSALFKQNCYYLEHAAPNLNFNGIDFIPRTRVKFIGRKFLRPGLPKFNYPQDPNPPKGKVFKYYSFELVRPYKISYIFSSKNSTTEDCLDSLTYLTVN